MSYVDRCYADLIHDIVYHGSEIKSRNSITKRHTGLQMRFNSTPLISIRKTAWKSALREMEWFLSGSNNINDLHPSVHPWWQPWVDQQGSVRNNYSVQLRNFAGHSNQFIDQIQYLIDTLTKDSGSRRAVITTWNTADMVNPETPITNCHGSIIQAFVEPSNKLEILMYQRSCDMLLGVPHNWIQYWAFMLWIAKETGREPGEFTWVGGDCHIYKDHIEIVKEIVDLSEGYIETPTLVYKGAKGDAFRADNFVLEGEYKPLSNKTAKMVV